MFSSIVLQIQTLKAKHVYMRDKEAVIRAVEKIRQGGANKLQVRAHVDTRLFMHFLR